MGEAIRTFRKNDIVTVEIVDIGKDGEGIGKAGGYTLFIKDAVVGDVVEAKIMKVKKNYAYARLEKVLTPSPFRIEPDCAFARECGGCQLQALSYEQQLQFKQKKVTEDLVRIGGFDKALIDSVMQPIIGMDEPFFYRNKAQYPIGTDKNGKPVAGFYAGRTHTIIANTDCRIGQTSDDAILQTVLQYMEKFRIPAYDERSGQGLIRHVLIRTGFATGEIMVCLVINGKKLPEEKQLADMLLDIDFSENKIHAKETDKSNIDREEITASEKNTINKKESSRKDGDDSNVKAVCKQIVSFCTSSNTKNTNVIMGESYDVIYGKAFITDKIGEVSFCISPLSFYQVNPIQTKKLYDMALAYADLNGNETVWDLYCGIGTISLFLAQKAGKVYGVEIVPQAIENAKENARLNHIENAEFFVGKAEDILPNQYEKNQAKADVIVVDPPRKGCDEKCLATMVQMQPKRIVYVSCDPATLARDLKFLCENGYELQRIRPTDMFPQCVHVETIVGLQRRDM